MIFSNGQRGKQKLLVLRYLFLHVGHLKKILDRQIDFR